MRIEYIPKYPNLELRWLPNSIRKTTPLPKIMVVSDSGASGWYYGPDTYDENLGDVKVGTIMIDTVSTCYEATLAHEFRHHWQRYNIGSEYDGKLDEWNPSASYKENIIHYYKNSFHEMDAFAFELKHAPNLENLEQREWILES